MEERLEKITVVHDPTERVVKDTREYVLCSFPMALSTEMTSLLYLERREGNWYNWLFNKRDKREHS